LIVVDSSALIAIIFDEPEANQFSDVVGEDGAPHASAFTLFETRTVLSFRGGSARLRQLQHWLDTAMVVSVAFDEQQSALALDAYQRWGKGNHPAGLNLGDCAAYALAKSLHAPLLFKGDDFSKTDIPRAVVISSPRT
jgi:ribonuclease VapC